jgi:hypothetical protein
MMFSSNDQLEVVFRKLHSIPAGDDVRVVEDEDSTGVKVGLYKNGNWCWGATVGEIACDLLIQQEVVAAREAIATRKVHLELDPLIV